MKLNPSVCAATAALVAAVASTAAPARADFLYHISVDTHSLIGHLAGPFSLDFQLIDGDGIADNTVTLTGLPSGSVVLTDAHFLNEIVQPFVPGPSLAFDLSTTNAFAGGIPDAFSFAILDSHGWEIPTFSPSGALLQMDLAGGAPSFQTFASDPSQAPAGISVPAPIVGAASTVVPEPGEWAAMGVLGAGLAGLLVRARRRA